MPAARLLSKAIWIFATRPVLPSNFHALISAGGAAPTKLKTDAPIVPGGLPRFAPEVLSCNRIVAVTPFTDNTSNPGADDGAGMGDGVARTFNPKLIFCEFVTLAVLSTSFASSRASLFTSVRAAFFAAVLALLRIGGSTAASAVA